MSSTNHLFGFHPLELRRNRSGNARLLQAHRSRKTPHETRPCILFSGNSSNSSSSSLLLRQQPIFFPFFFSRLFLSLSFYLSLLFFSIFGLLLFVFFLFLAAPSSLGCSGDQLLLTRMKCAVTCSLPNSRNVFYELIWLPEGCLLPSPPNRRTCGSTISRHKEEEDQRNFLLTLYFSGFSFLFSLTRSVGSSGRVRYNLVAFFLFQTKIFIIDCLLI